MTLWDDGIHLQQERAAINNNNSSTIILEHGLNKTNPFLLCHFEGGKGRLRICSLHRIRDGAARVAQPPRTRSWGELREPISVAESTTIVR